MISLEEQKVTDPKRIQWLLNSVKNQHQLLMLSIDKTNLADKLLVVDVSSENSYFTLDVSIDPDVHNKIAKGHSFSFQTSLNGVDVRAESAQASGTLDDEGGMLYKIPFPTELYYMQRRESFRASLTGLSNVPVLVETSCSDTGNPLTLESCSLTDISADGCQLSIPEDEAIHIVERTDAVTLQFNLPESDDTLTLSALPRHSRYIKRSALCLIGFQWSDTPPESQDILGKLITKLQMLARQKAM